MAYSPSRIHRSDASSYYSANIRLVSPDLSSLVCTFLCEPQLYRSSICISRNRWRITARRLAEQAEMGYPLDALCLCVPLMCLSTWALHGGTHAPRNPYDHGCEKLQTVHLQMMVSWSFICPSKSSSELKRGSRSLLTFVASFQYMSDLQI